MEPEDFPIFGICFWCSTIYLEECKGFAFARFKERKSVKVGLRIFMPLLCDWSFYRLCDQFNEQLRQLSAFFSPLPVTFRTLRTLRLCNFHWSQAALSLWDLRIHGKYVRITKAGGWPLMAKTWMFVVWKCSEWKETQTSMCHMSMEWTIESFLGWQINDMNDMNDIFESLESEFCPHCDSRSECQVDEEMEKAASTPSVRPESTDSMDSNGLDSANLCHLDRVQRVRGRKWILKRKNASCWSNNDSNGWRCSFGNDSKSERSIQNLFNPFFTKVRSPFFFAVMRVPYVILAVQLQLLRTFKSEKALQSFLEAQLLCPGSARPRSNASLWSKQKLQGWGHKSVQKARTSLNYNSMKVV